MQTQVAAGAGVGGPGAGEGFGTGLGVKLCHADAAKAGGLVATLCKSSFVSNHREFTLTLERDATICYRARLLPSFDSRS